MTGSFMAMWRVRVRGPFTASARASVLGAGIIVAAGSRGFGVEHTSLVIGVPSRADANEIVRRAVTDHGLIVLDDETVRVPTTPVDQVA
jgi:hypothetical protein